MSNQFGHVALIATAQRVYGLIAATNDADVSLKRSWFMYCNAWRMVRIVLRYAIYAYCLLLVLFSIFVCGSFLMDPYFGFDGHTKLIEISGEVAKRRLHDWPANVNPLDVQSVSYESNSSLDSNSSWYRIKLTASAAKEWANRFHSNQETSSRQCMHEGHEGLEGVHRMVDGPPSQHWQTGETPDWWKPPSIEFRATEVMLWYTNYESGVGRATYSAFDENSGQLWIYQYACQHDRLWTHGNVPGGNVFTLSKR